jgi:hypothetical protein
MAVTPENIAAELGRTADLSSVEYDQWAQWISDALMLIEARLGDPALLDQPKLGPYLPHEPRSGHDHRRMVVAALTGPHWSGRVLDPSQRLRLRPSALVLAEPRRAVLLMRRRHRRGSDLRDRRLLVSLADDIRRELPRLREVAESRMLDTCEIRYATGRMIQNEATGRETPEYALRFETKCRVKVGGGLASQDSEAGGRTIITVTRELHIPVDSPAVHPGDLAVITDVDPVLSDPSLIDAVLKLAGPAPGSQTTARRLQVEEEVA